jgi:general secretion pathway protein L
MIGFRQIRAGAGSLALWWLKQWQAALPDALRAAAATSRSTRLVMRCDDEEVTMSLVGPDHDIIFEKRSAAAEYARGMLDRCLRRAAPYARRRDVGLCLSCPDAITHSAIIPQQARSRAEEIIRDNISRKTPLKLSSVFIGYDLRAAGAGKLELRYLVLPKSTLEKRLAQLSVSPSELTALEGPAIGSSPPLVVPFARRQNSDGPLARRVAVALALLSVVSASVGFCALAWRQNAYLADLDARASEIAAPARQSAERLKAVYGVAEDISRFSELRGGPGIVQVWEEMARVLPASTYLTEVEIRGREVQMHGFSSAAPELLHLLETSPILHGAAFSGPVVFDRAKGKEQFQLRATLRKSRLAFEERN